MKPGSPTSPSQKQQPQGMNPFARALAEAEKPRAADGSQAQTPPLNPFSEALARTGGAIPENSPADQQRWQEQQLKDMEKQRKKEALRRKLHDQVNPVDMRAVYDAREKEVKKEIEALRQELKMLVRDVAQFEKEIELTIMAEVASPGTSGKYYVTFFRNLRSFIMLLRQKIRSARTWSSQFHAKQKKKKRGGLRIDGAAHEQTKTVFDMMHHERSTVYSGD